MQRILGYVPWLGTALVFAAVAIRLIKPEWAQYAAWAAWAGLACVVFYSLGQWREIVAAFRRRQARYGALASVSVLVVLGILVAVNYLSARQNKRWDLTETKQFSLSEQTVKLLRELKEPVKFVVFDRTMALDRFRLRLDEYTYYSNNVQVEYIDPDSKPVQAKEYGVESYGTVVIEYQGRRERVTSDTEQDLTNGLIKVLTPTQKKVYFVQGHGEKTTTNTERDGYSTIVASLTRDNYATDTLVLAQQQDVPADASVVVIAGPTTDLLQPEVDMLRRYLNRGGHAFILLDPPTSGKGGMPALEGLLREWNIEPGNNIVVDISGVGQLFGTGPETPVASSYPPHPITDRFSLLTAFPLARSISPIPDASGRTARTIAETSARSWAETNVKELEASGKVALNADQGDKPGPVSIAAVVAVQAPDSPATLASGDKPPGMEEPRAPETRLAVFGDSDFASNGLLGIQGNPDLFMNTVSWLAQQENLIAIRPRAEADRRLTLTGEQQRNVLWLTIAVPVALFATAFYTWSRRR
ncbi:MAG: GldG family protein [Candidatus Sericytochromatia bacterium]|uniref:GldG family protein n=1 Tax=Candidatus Tanganyikabacteria bacterium TaxID=2961651 RepID=A0A938BM52_9BACT|nr:GldG family protein [Candidatus Tanganyikabacteria bacterium]